MSNWTTVAADLAFPECPRWHDGALWFSDVYADRVVRLDLGTGEQRTMFSGGHHNAGLGFLPGGDLLVADGTSKQVLRVASDGSVSVHADLTGVATGQLNDMWVDAAGTAWVGNYGDDSAPPAPPFPAALAAVSATGAVRVGAPDLLFPNGVVVHEADRLLYVAETRSSPSRITAFTLGADGVLRDRRTLVEFGEGLFADGIALAPDGSLWVASPFTDQVIQVGAEGEQLRVLEVPHPYAVAVVGDDGTGLAVCSSPSWQVTEALAERRGRILLHDLD